MIALLITIFAIILLYLQKYRYAFFLHLFVLTEGFRFMMTPQLNVLGISFQHSDLSIIFIICAYNEYLFRANKNVLIKQSDLPKYFRLIWWFIALIFIEGFIDYFVNDTSIFDIYKTNRMWITLAVLPLYHFLLEDDLTWILNAIVVVTILQILIVPLQPVIGFEIPGSIRSGSDGGMRYGLMPYFWFLSFWYIYFNPKMEIKKKILFIVVIIFILMFVEARKNLLAIVISLLFVYSKKLSIKQIGITLFVVLALYCMMVKFMPTNRMIALDSEFESISDNKLEHFIKVQKTHPGKEGNFAFRYFLFQERYEYLKQFPIKFLFGYGFVHEKNVENNPFSIMVSGIHALDVGDISWAFLLTRYGILGIALMIVVLITFIAYFSRNFESDFFNKIGFSYMITVLVLSFGDSFLSSPAIFIVPYLINVRNKFICFTDEIVKI
jgi:hypothetical protein